MEIPPAPIALLSGPHHYALHLQYLPAYRARQRASQYSPNRHLCFSRANNREGRWYRLQYRQPCAFYGSRTRHLERLRKLLLGEICWYYLSGRKHQLGSGDTRRPSAPARWSFMVWRPRADILHQRKYQSFAPISAQPAHNQTVGRKANLLTCLINLG